MPRYDKETLTDNSIRLDTAIVGRAALNYRLARLTQKSKNGEPIEMKDVQLLRQFQAFLTVQQNEQVERYMGLCISAALNNFKRLKDGAAGDATGGALTNGEGGSSFSSSSACTALASSAATASACTSLGPLGKAAEPSVGAEMRDHLMSFFSKKQ